MNSPIRCASKATCDNVFQELIQVTIPGHRLVAGKPTVIPTAECQDSCYPEVFILLGIQHRSYPVLKLPTQISWTKRETNRCGGVLIVVLGFLVFGVLFGWFGSSGFYLGFVCLFFAGRGCCLGYSGGGFFGRTAIYRIYGKQLLISNFKTSMNSSFKKKNISKQVRMKIRVDVFRFIMQNQTASCDIYNFIPFSKES